MSDAIVLGVDCGTQSLRAGLYRADGTLLAQASQGYATDYPQTNWAEQQPEDWWKALCAVVPACLSEAGISGADVAAIACDGTSCTAVFCEEEGRPLRPAILWMDIRAADEAKRVEKSSDPVLDYCGRRISPEWMLPKVLWIQEHEPKIYDRAKRIVEGVDWLTQRITGRWVTATGNATGKRHWTPQGGWPTSLYDELGIGELTEKSPDEVLYVGDPVGTLLPEAAETLGLSPTCIVSHGGMDGWTAPIGKDCFTPGCASLTLGTSTVLILETDEPRCVEGIMGPFPDGIRRDFATYEAGQTSGGSTIGWLLNLLGIEPNSPAHAELEARARTLAPGAEGLVVFDAWRGNRTPYFDPAARGTVSGLTLEHGPAHLYRAMLEGCAYGIRNVVDRLDAGGFPISELRACGSGAGNALWVDIIASVLGKPIRVSAEKHATCLGSAVCATVACGAHESLEAAAAAMAPSHETVDPDLGIHQVYQPYLEAYLETYQQMKGVMKRLSDAP